ncbi:MAG: class I SAM-dependent methyltransferase [bacterium]
MRCKRCEHQSFYPRKESRRREDSHFSVEYSKLQQHNVGFLTSFKTRKYFIDFSRLALVSHYKFLNDGMKVLEIGPGFPGMFQQLILTKKNLGLYAVEPESESRNLLQKRNIKVIGNFFPLDYESPYMGFFDVIFACNILYYFHKPVVALTQMLHLLKEDGVILLDILNDKNIDDTYYENNTMTHIFSKASLRMTIDRAGARELFFNTCCVRIPQAAFENIEQENRKTLLKNMVRKVKNRVKITHHNEVMSYFAQATQLKYGDPEGQYIRAVIGKKN